MSIYLDTRGKSSLAVGICGRCSRKMPLVDLRPDPNTPGLLVCDEDRDVLDPYRMAPRQLERISLDNPRPDVSIALRYAGAVPVPIWANQPFTVTLLGAAAPWQKLKVYKAGDTITPLNVSLDTTPLPQNWWMCVLGGTSGDQPPDWPTEPGVLLGDYIGLTSDIRSVIRLLDDSGLINITDDDRAKFLTADDPIVPVDDGLQLLSDSGLRLFADSNGDGTVCWLNLGIYPL